MEEMKQYQWKKDSSLRSNNFHAYTIKVYSFSYLNSHLSKNGGATVVTIITKIRTA